MLRGNGLSLLHSVSWSGPEAGCLNHPQASCVLALNVGCWLGQNQHTCIRSLQEGLAASPPTAVGFRGQASVKTRKQVRIGGRMYDLALEVTQPHFCYRHRLPQILKGIYQSHLSIEKCQCHIVRKNLMERALPSILGKNKYNPI